MIRPRQTVLRQGVAVPPRGGLGSLDQALQRLEIRAAWKALTREPPSFWLLCGYFLIEYVRPQMIYPWLDVIPWGLTMLGAAGIAWMLEGGRLRRFQPLDGFLLLFTLIWALSILGAQDMESSLLNWTDFANWIIVYFLTSNIVTTPRKFFLFMVFFLLWSLKLSQHGARTFVMRGFSFAAWGVMGPEGWFQNSGEMAIQMCVFFAMSLFFAFGLRDRLPRWKFWGLLGLLPGTAALTLIATSSRGGQLGLLAIIVAAILYSRQRVKTLVGAVLVLAALWMVLPEEQRARFDSMGDDETSVARTTLWGHGIEIANDFPILGVGYDGWLPYYREHYDPAGQLPHNIFVEAGAELGYTGLAAFLLLLLGSWRANTNTRRLAKSIPDWGPVLGNAATGLDLAVLGFVVSGFFVTVLFYPYFWVSLAISAALLETTRRAAGTAQKRMELPHASPTLPRGVPGKRTAALASQWHRS